MTEKIENILGALTPNAEEISAPAVPVEVSEEVSSPDNILNPVKETGGVDGAVTMAQALEDTLAINGLTMADYNIMNAAMQQGWLTRARLKFKERIAIKSNTSYDSLPHYMFLSNGEKYHTRADGVILDKASKNMGVRYVVKKGEVGFFPRHILLKWERKRLLHESKGGDPEYNTALLNDFYEKVRTNTFINDYQKETARDRYGNPWKKSPHNPDNKK